MLGIRTVYTGRSDTYKNIEHITKHLLFLLGPLCYLTSNGSCVECACLVPFKMSNKTKNYYCQNCEGALQDTKTMKRYTAKATGTLNGLRSVHEAQKDDYERR